MGASMVRREGRVRRGEVSKVAKGGGGGAPPPASQPRDFLVLGDGHGDERLPGRCLSDPGALQLLPFLKPGFRRSRPIFFLFGFVKSSWVCPSHAVSTERPRDKIIGWGGKGLSMNT